MPERLRTEKGLYPLDTFNDNFCVFRCLAVHRGAHKKNNLRITRRLGHNIFSQYTKFQMHQSPCTKEHFIQGVNSTKTACYWTESEAKRHRIHIRYQLCGKGGEQLIAGHPVDGYLHESKTIYQFHGCHFHGCPQCYQDRDYVLHTEIGQDVTREDVYQMTDILKETTVT